MKIKNQDGRSWVTIDTITLASWLTIHITNAEVESAELKGSNLVIVVSRVSEE